MPTTTNLQQLIINNYHQADYDTITTSPTELYFTDEVISSSDVITALGYTPVNQAGDTMTGALTINKNAAPQFKLRHPDEVAGTTPLAQQAVQLAFQDANANTLGYIQNVYNADGTRATVINSRNADCTTNTSIVVGYDGNGNSYFSFPKSTCVDSAWVMSYSQLISSNTSIAASTTLEYSLATYLPSDNYNYEVMFTVDGYTGSTSGDKAEITVGSSLIDINTYRVATTQARTANTTLWCGSGYMLIGSDKKIYVRQTQTMAATISHFRLYAYRRIGTNA